MQLNIPLKRLLELVGGQSEVDPDFLVHNLTSLRSARESDVAVVFDPEDNSVFDSISLGEIKLSRAGLVIASKKLVDDKSFIIVPDPLMAFQKIVDFIEQDDVFEVHKSAVLHETVILEDDIRVGANVVIDKNARIGEGTDIGSLAYIGENVRIGGNVKIHPGVKILKGTVIGDNTIIHSGAIIGGDGYGYWASRSGMKKIPQVGIVRIGRDVEIGSNTCIDRSTFDETIISDGVKIDNLVHIAHNVHIGPHTAIISLTGIAGSARIGAGCMIGGQVGIKDHVTIGNNVKIVSRSAIMKNIKDGEVVAGVPAMPFSQWKRLKVAETKLPELIKQGKDIKKKLSEKKSIFGSIFGSF